ncbi:MAG: dihydroflavonol-4-reductase, partial [Bradymonadia bacterium]
KQTTPKTSPKTALVTGATGFVGRHLCRHLHERGFAVRALVRATSDLTPIRPYIAETFVGDLSRPESVVGCCDGVHAVYHSACAIASTYDSGRAVQDVFRTVNRDGTTAIAREVMKQKGVRMVHLSSTAAIGQPLTRVVNEDSPTNPQTPYQRSKRDAELELLEMHERDGLDVVMIRTCLVTGPGKIDSELLTMFRLIKRGVFPYLGSDLSIQKPMVHVDDLCTGLMLAHDNAPGGRIYLITSGARHEFGDILRSSGDLLGVKRTHLHVPIPLARAASTAFKLVNRILPDWSAPLTDDRINLFITDRPIDISRAREEIGYDPQHTNTKEMLESTVAYYVGRGMV